MSELLTDVWAIGSFLVALTIGVWRITHVMSKQTAELKLDASQKYTELMAKISALALKVNAIEVETKHVRDDHDYVVKFATILEKAQTDINNQYGRIKDIEKDFSKFGNEISKLRRVD